MLIYDITKPPPSRQELETEKKLLTQLKRQQVKASFVADGCHGIAFALLYFTNHISGHTLLMAIVLATVVAVTLAATLKKQMRSTDIAMVVFSALLTISIVMGIAIWVMDETIFGGISVGLISGSIVSTGAIVGRKFFHIFIGLENLIHIAEDEYAVQELQELCRDYPDLEKYRQQARDILRPNLTFGELQAMRKYASKLK